MEKCYIYPMMFPGSRAVLTWDSPSSLAFAKAVTGKKQRSFAFITACKTAGGAAEEIQSFGLETAPREPSVPPLLSAESRLNGSKKKEQAFHHVSAN